MKPSFLPFGCRTVSSITVAAFLSAVVFSPQAHGQTAGPYAREISASIYLPQRLVWVGEQPPAEEESQQLLEILQVWRSSKGQLGLADLEMHLAAYTNSPWAPSLHANLALHYRSRGQTSGALEHWEEALLATKDFTQGDGVLTTSS